MEEATPDASWDEWGDIVPEHVRKRKNQKRSRYAAQQDANMTIQCCVGFALPCDGGTQEYKIVYGLKEFAEIRIAIAGGSDEPHFSLTMTHGPSNQTATIAFSSWTLKQPAGAASRVVNRYPDTPPSGPHDFSQQLFNVFFRQLESFTLEVDKHKWFAHSAKGFPLQLEWQTSDRPSGLATEVDTTMMPSECAQMFQTFKCLVRACEVRVFARGSGTFLDCWKLFCAQPSPTPPHWWRFSTKTEPNQHVLDLLPTNLEGSQLWQHHHDRTDEEKKLSPIQTPKTRFMSTRDYEIFVVGSLLRSAEAQEKLYVSHWNGRHDYTLRSPQDFAFSLKFDKVYVVTLELHVKGADYNIDVPPPPDVGTVVFIVDGDHEFSGFIQAVDDNNVVSIVVTTTRGTGALVLKKRNGRFRFGIPNAPFVAAQKAINQALYFTPIPDFVPWIRTLALAQENQTIRPLNPRPLVANWRQLFPPMNQRQDLALRQTCALGGGLLENKINIIQGPPGTGKTHMVAQAVVDAYTKSHKVLVVAETRFATHTDAVAIEKALNQAGLLTDNVFLIEHTSTSGMDFGVEANDNADDDTSPALVALSGAQINADNETSGPEMSTNSRITVIHQLHKLLNAKTLSLEAHINKRIDLMKVDDPSLVIEEIVLLAELTKWRAKVSDRLMDPADAEQVYKDFGKVWAAVQRYYLDHAQVVVVTAATSLNSILRSFKPRRLIIDEGSQMKEFTTIAVIAHHSKKLDKITIIGDLAQLGTFVPPIPSEFSVQTKVSCMGRMVDSGVPFTMLDIQYRMHPHISRLVSQLFYQNRLLDDQSVLFRQDDNKWIAFTQQVFRDCLGHHSIFVHATAGPVYRTKRDRSLANPRHACIVELMLRKLCDAGAAPNQIAVLCGYKAQLRVLRRLPAAVGVTLATIDSAQGHEYPFVLLDLATPGGIQYPLGFLCDTGRMCVALSRAMNGMLIIGNADMATEKYQNQGVKGWQTLVDDHRNRGALVERHPPGEKITAMVETLGLEGPQWTKVTPK